MYSENIHIPQIMNISMISHNNTDDDDEVVLQLPVYEQIREQLS